MPVKARLLQHGILLGAVIVTGLILPNSYDPISVPKMFMLAVVVGIGLIFVKFTVLQFRNWDLLTYAAVSFAILLVMNLLIHNSALPERLFGVSGRSTGFLTLTAFLLLFLIARNSLYSISTFLYYLASANIIVSGYFVSQFFGFDFANFQEYYGAPSSTLGNPNFVSGFLGFSSIVFLDLFRKYLNKVLISLPLLMVFSVDVWVISKTDSIQGFVALGLGLFTYFSYGIFVILGRAKFMRLSPIFLMALTPIMLGFLGIGPLSQYLTSTTVFSRLDYWRASLSMLLDNPLTGVGLDAFGDNYRLYRDDRALARFGESQITDSAHNVYLDIFSYGGLTLGFLYVALNLIPLWLFLGKVRSVQSQSEMREQVVLLALWFAFQIQTLVSVNQIGVTIWIWLILGLMSSSISERNQKTKAMKELGLGTMLLSRTLMIGVSITLVFFSYTPLRTNIEFLSAANKADGLAMKNIVERFPQDSKLIALVASGFQNSNYSTLALEILNRGTRHNPDSFNLWKLIYENPKTPELEKNLALKELKRLDPRFPYQG
jgi:O-antigen ligase